MKDAITEKVEELEARLKAIEDTSSLYKTSLIKLEEELILLRKIAVAVDSYQLKTKYVAGDFTELYTLITEYRQRML